MTRIHKSMAETGKNYSEAVREADSKDNTKPSRGAEIVKTISEIVWSNTWQKQQRKIALVNLLLKSNR